MIQRTGSSGSPCKYRADINPSVHTCGISARKRPHFLFFSGICHGDASGKNHFILGQKSTAGKTVFEPERDQAGLVRLFYPSKSTYISPIQMAIWPHEQNYRLCESGHKTFFISEL